MGNGDLDGECGVAEPGVAVIPVAAPPELLGQRRSRGGDNAAGVGVGERPQHQQRAGSQGIMVVNRQLGGPVGPERHSSAECFIRVDWSTPDGLGAWGDGRLFLLGTEGYIELRKYIDIAGRPGANHLFLVDFPKSPRTICRKYVQYCSSSGASDNP